MRERWRWRLRRLLQQIWVPVALMGLLGLAASLGAALFAPVIPEGAVTRIGADSVGKILTIIASSMLTVTTFSLSIMVTAFGSAASGATPRALALLQGDRTTQRVLATFIGAFVYAVVGIVALETRLYGDAGRFVLFVVTIGVIALVIGVLLRWVQHLTVFGLLDDTIGRVEAAALEALQSWAAAPLMGCARWQEPPPGAFAVTARLTGHVQHIDLALLQETAEAEGFRLWLLARPGAFLHPATPLLLCDALPGDAAARAALEMRLRAGFDVDHGRSYEQDPRFGLIALAEIAQRALSPAVNDPGTAMDILGRLTRVLAEWRPVELPEVVQDRIFLRPAAPGKLIDDAFGAIARDGAGMVEVAVRLQEALAALALIAPRDFGAAAVRQADRAARMAAAALPLPEDRERVTAMAQALAGQD